MGLWDDNKDLKYYLRIAEKYRRDGSAFHEKGDYENAFVEFARAATLVLEKLPTHRDYHNLLNTAQRHNLGLVRISLSGVYPPDGHILYSDTWTVYSIQSRVLSLVLNWSYMAIPRYVTDIFVAMF